MERHAACKRRDIHALRDLEIHAHRRPRPGLNGVMIGIDHALGGHDRMDRGRHPDRLRGVRRRIPPRMIHAAEIRGLARFGIQQKLGRDHHPFAGLQAALYGRIPGVEPPDFDRDRFKPPLAQRQHHTIPRARADDGFLRDCQHIVFGLRLDSDSCEHIGFQQGVGVRETQAHARRAGLGIERWINVIHRPLPALSRQVIQRHDGRQAGADQRRLAFKHFGLHPDIVQRADRHQGRARLDEETFADIQFFHHPRLRRVESQDLAYGLPAL